GAGCLEPKVGGRQEIEQPRIEPERRCGAPRELRALEDLRARGVVCPARTEVHELDDGAREIWRRRRRDELVRRNREALPRAELLDELRDEARPRFRPTVHAGDAEDEMVRA